MADAFEALKRSRKSLHDKLVENSNKESSKSKTYEEDTRFWKPVVDKAGNGFARIRFLPPPQNEDGAWVKYWDHFFKGNNNLWYVENSLTSLGKDDPCSEYNSTLWNSVSNEEDPKNESPARAQAKRQKRRLHYISNILVVNDPANPENNGKVFLYDYGVKIFEKIDEMINPSISEFQNEDDVEKINPFDLWEGCDFIIKIKTKNSFRNYDDSHFDVGNITPVAKDDDHIRKIWESEYSLQTFLDPSNFKSYDELKDRLHKVLGIVGTTAHYSSDEMDVDKEVAVSPVAEADDTPFETHSEVSPTANYSDLDDDMDFFEKLANDG